IKPIKDDFSVQILNDRWQWSVFQPVIKSTRNGELNLMAIPTPPGAYVGTKVFSANYKTTILVNTKKSNASPGLGLIGDDKNSISVVYDDNKVSLIVLENGKETSILTSTVKPKKKLFLTAEVIHNKNIHFFYSTDGKKYKRLNESAIDCSFLPPWDRAVRVGLISRGTSDQKSVFDFFELINTTTNTNPVK
ncbi:MAG: beta-xylosidase family glycoside hydrolase, partial [Flavitalea sp.]